ncbi:MAG: aldehyde dehydrogenase family protein [Saprospiraceae bacterium]|nr:aldehyde dehydrogenase family protein [Saprospiraceae bacterium]
MKNSYPSAKERIELMKVVPDMLLHYSTKLTEALHTDFGGHSEDASDLFEILGMFDRSKYNIANVEKWMKPIAKEGNPVTQGKSKAYVKYHPKGVIGNMVSWNFPFDIALGPMLDQLGAGNRVIIKSSDLSPASGAVLQEMLLKTYNEDQVAVVNGGLDLAKYFPTLPWNHLIYTGSGTVGRLIMKAAAENLVPVTLELGGKSPSIVGPDRITDETIATIAGVKVVKRGQMCVTVDYCLVPEAEKDVFVDKIANYMQTHFAKDNARNHACGIITQRHVKRLQGLVDEAKASGAKVIQIGNDLKDGSRDMPFYIVVDPSDDLQMIREEIFGPILPIKTYKTTQDAIDYINKNDRPLGLYVFSDDRKFIDDITQNTHSGGVAVNMIALQAAQPSMGFGGVGASGMGRHHGVEGFQEFSYPKGYFERGNGGTIDWIMPPFDSKTRQLIHDVAYAPLSKQLKFAIKRLPNILLGK